MLFLNISSDKVQISDWKKEKYLDRSGIENTLGPTLVQRYRKAPFDQVLVLNWPWGFTNLRVGTLVINLLNKLVKAKVEVYSVSKPDLYKYLFKKWILPRFGAIYLGQRLNVWLYDFQKSKYQTIKLEEIKNKPFLDFVKEKYRPKWAGEMIKFQMTNKWLNIKYKNKNHLVLIKELKLKPQNQIKPEYFIHPITC